MKEQFLFELKYRFKRPATYIYFGILFFMSFIALASDAVQIGGGQGQVYINAPIVVNNFIIILSIVGMAISSAVLSVPIYRDFEHKMFTFYYSLPISKGGYFWGRFLGSFVVLLFIFLGVYFGIILGSVMPWQEAEKVGPIHLMHYLQPYLIFAIPNLLFTGAIFFALVALTRNALAAYTGNVILLVGYLIGSTLASDLDNRELSALFDPFGIQAANYITQYWTIAERNTMAVPLESILLYNRLIWVSFSIVVLVLSFVRFKLGIPQKSSKKQVTKETLADAPVISLKDLKPQQIFSNATLLKQMFSLASLEFRNIRRDVYFIAMAVAGIIFLFADGWFVDQLYGTSTYPVTYNMLSIKDGTFGLLTLIIIVFYTGELVKRERSLKYANFADAFPTPNWLGLGSKILAMIYVSITLCILVIIAGVLVQTFKGYFKYEFGIYLSELFLITLPRYLMLVGLAFFIQTLVANKYLGHFIMVLSFILTITLNINGFNHNLYLINNIPRYTFSDMNGYGHFVAPIFWFSLYWFLFACFLIVLSNLFWARGAETNLKVRFKVAKARFGRPAKLAFFTVLFLWIATGCYTFYNTNIINTYQTSDQVNELTAEYEKKYKKYEGIPQPRITDVKVYTDIFPEERRVAVRGIYTIQNKEKTTIDSLHLVINSGIDIKEIKIGGTKVEPILADPTHSYYIYKMPTTLKPKAKINLEFSIELDNKGFRNNGETNQIAANGTFFNSGFLPHIGYSAGQELTSIDDRKDFDLPPKPRMPDLYDKEAYQNTYISDEADWVTYEAIVSTSPDQTAISPGYLIKEWEENDRKYFHYKMDSKILNFYSFLSGRYEVLRDKWTSKDGKEVNIEIYYHKGHEYNLDKMVDGIKMSLDYFTQNFSSYQHRQMRIIEFPRYATFAQSFPNTVPYSESIGFIAKVDEWAEDDLNYPFYVTSHEVAHQWWAHQVIGANVQGGTLMSETLAQYSALMVMKQKYGKDKMKNFLRYELDSYLRGRSSEQRKELPLYLVENQGYIHYRKGSLIMYALQDYIGEKAVNQALSKYIKEVAFQEAPYTTSLEFLKFIKAETPDSLKYVVEDMFEKIILYENRALEASYQKLAEDKYEVTLKFSAKKLEADSLGYEKEIKMHDWVDIGVFGAKKEKEKEQTPLYLQKHHIKAGENTVKIIVNEKPEKAGIDPYFKLVDRNPEDNTKGLTEESSS